MRFSFFKESTPIFLRELHAPGVLRVKALGVFP